MPEETKVEAVFQKHVAQLKKVADTWKSIRVDALVLAQTKRDRVLLDKLEKNRRTLQSLIDTIEKG